MIEYLDPYHWSSLGLVPHEDAQWRDKVMVRYDYRNEEAYYLEVEDGRLFIVYVDEVRHLTHRREEGISRANTILGIGKGRRNPDGDKEYPILTTDKVYLYRQWSEGYRIDDHPGSSSVFYPA